MKKTLILFTFICISLQNTNANNDTIKTDNRKYIAWFSPSKVTHMYGIMFNFWTSDDLYFVSSYNVYGLELNLNPLSLLASMTMVPVHVVLGHTIGLISGETTLYGGEHYLSKVDTIDFTKFKKVYGLQIGSVDIENTIVNGLDLNVGRFQSKNNGVCISVLINDHYVMNGVAIVAVVNHAAKCNGIQLGLINTSGQLKGVQIGLWNINQKRSLPFINWCFNSPKRSVSKVDKDSGK